MAAGPMNREKLARLLLLASGFVSMLLLLLVRLWHVQVYQHGSHEEQTVRQSVRRIRTLPVRGRIYARDGSLLVDNRVSYELIFHVSEMRQPGARANTVRHIMEQGRRLAVLLGREVPFTETYIERRLNVYPALPITVFSDLNDFELALAAELPGAVKGVELSHSIGRRYPHPGLATHVLGFCGRVQPSLETETDAFSYVPLELRGREGLERLYDRELAGSGGMKMVRVDTLGYVHEEIGEGFPPVKGMDLELTLDLDAQRIAESLLDGLTGALVVVDVRRGGILAMASAPTYDLSRLSSDEYGRLAQDEERRPLLNRAVAAGYLPGSILKPLIALAALEEGRLTAEDEHYCSGQFRLTPRARPIRCWNRAGHGPLNVIEAIQYSCNPFFNHYAVETGLDRIRPLLLSAGLGRSPAIDLPVPAGGGLVPSRQWARQRLRREWLAIDTAFIAIGQGSVTISPLQAALYTAAIANDGTLFRPYLVQKIIGPDGRIRKNTPPVPEARLPVSAEHLALVQEGMYRAVNRTRGTARQAHNSAVSLAGKTGTAQVVKPDASYNDTWFIGYGPVEEPRWAIAILIERGDSGGSTAAPLAADFFSRWIN